MTPGRVTKHAHDDDDARTRRYRDMLRGEEPGTVELVLEERPADPIGAKRVLANLERRLIGDRGTQTDITRYVLLQQIGAGGLGAVYAAYDPELDRRIALKFLHTRADDDPRAQDRLVREAKAMAKLSHPNVVTVFDVGMVDGQVFIAMELIDGVPLSTFLRAKPRGWKQVRDVMVQAGRGLQAAHAAGLVHRDFKPQNVLVGADGRARVLDFGLARFSDAAMPAAAPAWPSTTEMDERLTQTGAIMGTPAYMAPEQIDAREVGPAADQFAFCVALFEGLYGARPFVGEGAFGVTEAIRKGEITPPKATRDVPAWLHKAVLRGLSRDSAARFGSVRELLDAITVDQRARRRYGLLAVLVACLLGGVIGAGSVWLRPGATEEERAEIEARVQSARDAAEAGDFVYPPPDDAQRETAYSIVRALERIEGASGSLARAEAQSLRTELAAALVELGDRYWEDDGGAPFAADFYANALMFDESLERARERASLTRGELRSLIEKADERAFSEGELVAAQSLAVLSDPDPDRRAERLDELAASGTPPSPTTAARLRGLVRTKKAARVAKSEPPPRKVEREAPVALALPEPAEDAAPKDRTRADADALVQAAEAALRRGDRKSAEQLYNQAIRAERRHARALAGLAQLHFDSGQNHKAVTYAKLAVAAAPRNGALRILLGDALVKTLDYDAAKHEYTRARTLGSPAAAKRLALLEDKLGG